MLEVVVDDADAVYVASAWGDEAQWLRNIRADPEVTFHLGSTRSRTRAEIVGAEEARAVMARYATRHPRALDRLSAFMLDEPGHTPEVQAARVAETVPIVRLPK